jgi:serine/threonine protein kinase
VSLRSTYLAHLKTVGVDAATLVVDDRGTMGPPRARRSIAALPVIEVEGDDAVLRVGSKVGGGGMGEVHQATQVSLKRRVAVKTPLTRDPVASAALFDEALVMGALGHPNVVPVHALGRGSNGEPMLVMKFIEGTLWSESIEPLFEGDDDDEHDIVDEHLRALAQVCNAVSFAHSMGILHRDLKPDNVMLGRFGEVYVLDWGLAVALHADAPGELVLAKDISTPVGTPAYMAPEMAAANGEQIGVHSDIYLLGATLFELITGGAPHDADTLLEALASSFSSKPRTFAASVPRELAAVCGRALSFEPDERYQSVTDFRDALLGFLRHRSSERVARDAIERVERLRRVLDEDDVDEAEVGDLSAEARFGFQLALTDWAESPDALVGIDELVELLVDWHLSRDDPRAASAAMRDLPEPNEPLAARIQQHTDRVLYRETERVRELESLRQLALDSTLKIEQPYRGRLIWVVLATLLLPVGALTTLRFVYGRKTGYPEVFGLMVLLIVATAIVRHLVSPHVNTMSRHLQTAIVVATACLTMIVAVGWYMDMDLSASLAMVMFCSAAMSVTAAQFVTRELLWTALPMCLGGVGIALFPKYRGIFVAVGYTAAFGIGSYFWSRASIENPEA